MLRELLLDESILPDLAEICGIHAGDGYLRNDGRRRELDISGGFEEKEYYDSHVIPLCEKVFSTNITGRYFKSRNTYGFVIRDKDIVNFMLSLGFPNGKKTLTVKAPEFVMTSRNLDIIYRFIRGVFDTDGCLNFRKREGSNYAKCDKLKHSYPRIQISLCSKYLIDDLADLLTRTGFQFRKYHQKIKIDNHNSQFKIYLRGYQNLENWMFNIGIKNTSKLSRFNIWKKFGFCPSYTTFEQRTQILNNELDPNLFYPAL